MENCEGSSNLQGLNNNSQQASSSKREYQDIQKHATESETALMKEDINGRERLKRHRIEVAGNVWIPETWGQEELLKDWIDSSGFDSCLAPKGIMSARQALIHEGRRASIVNTC